MSNIGTDRVCPNCGNTHIISVEYGYGNPERYDGISEYVCYKTEDSGCGYREGRWTGFELHDGEIEPRYGAIWDNKARKTVKATAPVKVKK